MPDDAQIGRFPRNPFLVPSDSTLADVLALIEGDGPMLPTRRRDLSSAIRRACDLLGRDPAMIPANVAELKRGLAQVSPVAMGCTPKTLQNIKSGLLAALRHTGVAIAPNTQHTRLSPKWRCLRDTLPDQQYRAGLSRLMHFCAAQGIDPGDVDDAVVSVFMLAVREGTFASKPDAIHRRTCQLWNKAADAVPGWPRQRLTVPDHRKPRTSLPLRAFPASFQDDVARHLAWLEDPDPFAEHRPPKAYKPRTIDLCRKYIELAASAYVHRGGGIEDFGSLADLVAPDRVKEIMRHYLENTRDATNPHGFARALCVAIIHIARHWVRVDAEQLERLKDIKRRLGPERDAFTPKNRAFLRQFDDPDNLARLLRLPGILTKEAQELIKRGPKRAAVRAQIAIAIEILLMAPMRGHNLIALQFDSNLVRPGGRDGLWQVALEPSETKTGEASDYEFPRHLTDMIDDYVARLRPHLTGPDNTYLFPNKAQAHKAQRTLSQQIKETIGKRTGLRATVHQFRHLAAKLELTMGSGLMSETARLLGHKNLKTTVSFYAGLQTNLAARRYQDVIQRERESIARPRDGKRHGSR